MKQHHKFFLFCLLFLIVFNAIAFSIHGCAYGSGYWLFPQDNNGYHFDPCLHIDKVRPEDRQWYKDTCP